MELELQTPEVFLPLLPKARYKGARGGRGSGKSHFFAESLLERAMMRKTRAACVREIQKSLEASVMQLLADKIDKLNLGRYFQVMDTEIRGPNKSKFLFQGMRNHTADSIKSFEDLDIAWVEEAQSMSQKSLDLLRPTVRGLESEIWFSWNPFSPKDPVDEFMMSKPPRSVMVLANWQHNPWFRKSPLYEEMLWDRKRDKLKYKHIWEGGYLAHSGARVFNNWQVINRTEMRELMGNGYEWVTMQGADWGYAKDPTVMVRVNLHERQKIIIIEAEVYRIGVEIDHTPKLFRGIPGSELIPTVADSARPETISYVQRNGFPLLIKSIKGPNSVMEGVEFLKNYDIFVLDTCTHAIDELTYYSWVVDEHTGLVLPKLEDKKNHVIDSIRYAIEPIRKPRKGLL